jgi:hypothetical protein
MCDLSPAAHLVDEDRRRRMVVVALDDTPLQEWVASSRLATPARMPSSGSASYPENAPRATASARRFRHVPLAFGAPPSFGDRGRKWPRPCHVSLGAPPITRMQASWGKAVGWSLWSDLARRLQGSVLPQSAVEERQQCLGLKGIPGCMPSVAMTA